MTKLKDSSHSSSFILAIIIFIFFQITHLSAYHLQYIPLQIQGEIQAVYLWHLNDDENPDLVVTHSLVSPHGIKRFISVFINRNCLSPCIPDHTFLLNNKESFFDFVHLDEGQKGFLFLQSDGLYFQSWRNETADSVRKKIIPLKNTMPFYDPAQIMHRTLSMDLNGDNSPELIIPGLNFIYLFTKDTTKKYIPYLNSPIPIDSQVRAIDSNQLTYSFPKLYLKQIKKTRLKEVCIWQNQSMSIFKQNPEKNLFQRYANDVIQIPCEIVSGTYSRNVEKLKISPYLIDINKDQYTDLLVRVQSPNYFPFSMNQLQVYLNQGGVFPKAPDQVLSANNIEGEFILHDFNQDTYTDAGLLQLEIGLVEIMSFLLTGRLKARLDLYHGVPHQLFSEIPDANFSFSWRPSLMTAMGKKAFLLNIKGDYNGDGLKDLLVGIFPYTLQLYIANEEGNFIKDTFAVFHLPLSKNYQLIDWDMNGKTDLIFWEANSKVLSNQLTWIQF